MFAQPPAEGDEPPARRRHADKAAAGRKHALAPEPVADDAGWEALSELYNNMGEDDLMRVVVTQHLARCLACNFKSGDDKPFTYTAYHVYQLVPNNLCANLHCVSGLVMASHHSAVLHGADALAQRPQLLRSSRGARSRPSVSLTTCTPLSGLTHLTRCASHRRRPDVLARKPLKLLSNIVFAPSLIHDSREQRAADRRPERTPASSSTANCRAVRSSPCGPGSPSGATRLPAAWL